MEGNPTSQFFLEPKEVFHRRYEALRAVCVGGEPLDRVAERFGYTISALRSMASHLRADCRRGITPLFSSRTGVADRTGRAPAQTDRASNRPKSRTVGN